MRSRRPASRAKLPDALPLNILKYSHDGRGIARHEGRVVMVANAMPGEQVVAKIEQGNSNLWQGRTIEISSPSPARQTPKCKLFGYCGGCQIQQIPQEDQLILKQEAVIDHLTRNDVDIVPWAAPIVSTEFEYRHRARFHVSKKGQIGFHAQKGNEVVAVAQCPVFTVPLQIAYSELLEVAPLKGLSQLELIVDDFGNIGTKALKGHQPAIDAYHQWAAEKGWHCDEQLKYYSGSRTVTALPGEFTQVNREINHQMIKQAIEWLNLKPSDHVLDLFCGNGNFSLAISSFVDQVLGLEASESAIIQAQQASDSSNGSISFKAVNLFTADLHALPEVQEMDATAVILDPPRAGAEYLCEGLKRLSLVDKILYVSCDPATLARDIKILNKSNWHLSKLGLIDMFPQTRHIETMALLEK